MSQPELEDVSTSAPICGNEVEVIASHVQALGVPREAEAYEAAMYVVEFKGRLVLDNVSEGRVGLALARNAARLEVVEPAVHANGVARSLAAD